MSPPLKSQSVSEAAQWLARLRSDAATADDDRAFQAWADSDPENRRAFEACTRMWESIGGMNSRHAIEAISPPVLSRRRVLALGGAGAAVIGGAGFWLASAEDVYATQIGEQRRFTLKDGSTIMLDACSEARVRMTRNHRLVRLVRGRISLSARPTRSNPFILDLGDRQVVVLGREIQASRIGDATSILALDGSAQVKRGATLVKLSAGQELQAVKTLVQTRAANVSDETSWQYGRVVFTNEPLLSAVERMNTYNTHALKVADPSIAQTRISGAFRVGDNEAFARSVAALLNVSVERQGGSILIGDGS